MTVRGSLWSQMSSSQCPVLQGKPRGLISDDFLLVSWANITKFHKLDGFQQLKCILSSQEPGSLNPGRWQGWFLQEAMEGNVAQASVPAAGGGQHFFVSLTCRFIAPLSALAVRRLPPSAPLLIRMPVTLDFGPA